MLFKSRNVTQLFPVVETISIHYTSKIPKDTPTHSRTTQHFPPHILVTKWMSVNKNHMTNAA